jgi:hypothetical protein
MIPVHDVELGPLSWLPGQWWPYRHAVSNGAPTETLSNGVTVRFGLCGLATVARRSHWPRCPVCLHRSKESSNQYREEKMSVSQH